MEDGKIIEDKKIEYRTKLALTAICAAVCSVWAVMTYGESGIGWFLLSMFLIWF